MGPGRFAILLTCAGCAAAGAPEGNHGIESPERPATAYREALALTLENDAIIGSDNNYTNGLGLTWISRERSQYPEDSLRRRWIELGSSLPFAGGEQYHTFVAVTLGHEIFTPKDIVNPAPPPADRPYAGVLFLESAFLALSPRVSHSWVARAGLVGPSSLAEDVQRAVHKTTGSDEPRWDQELPDEPFLNLDYNVAYQLLDGGRPGAGAWRLVPVGTVGVGTYFTGVGAAFYGEVGWNLPEVVGLISVRRGVDPFSTIGAAARTPLSLSAYAGIGGFGVAHYLPLDGTVFRSSPSVDSEPLVGFATAGLAARRGRWAVGLLLTSFTDTFRGQPSSESFGTFTLSWSL